MALSATSNAPRRSLRSSRTSASSRVSVGRAAGLRSAAIAPIARPPTNGRPVSVTLRVPPPALREIGRSRRESMSSAWRIPPAMMPPERRQELDVALLEAASCALDDERSERAGLAADRHGEEHRVTLLAEDLEVLVGRVLRRVLARDGAQVLDGLARHALADVEADLADGARREADVAAHDQLVAVALDDVERADVGPEDLRDPSRRLVEQRDQGHRLRGKGHEIEDTVEALVASQVDLRLGLVASSYGTGVSRATREPVQGG